MEDGTAELIRLTKLLRLGSKTVGDIARIRTTDYAALMDIVDRAETMADDLDKITGRPTTVVRIQ